MSEQPIYSWKKWFGTFQPDDVRAGDRAAEKLVAERDIEIEVMKETAAAGRAQLADAVRCGLSHRRSCTLLKVDRSAVRYRSVKAPKSAPVLARRSMIVK